jgi:hypothetical protein
VLTAERPYHYVRDFFSEPIGSHPARSPALAHLSSAAGQLSAGHTE